MNEGLDIGSIAYVAGYGGHVVPERAQRACFPFDDVLAQVRQHDARAFGGQAPRNREPYATGAAGDQRDPSLETRLVHLSSHSPAF